MSPEANHCPSWMRVVAPCSPTSTKAIHDRTQDRNRSAVVTTSLGRDPMRRPNSPAIRKPTSGRKTMAWYMRPVQPFIMFTSSTAIEPRLR